MRDQIKAFSLPPNEKPGDDNGVKHLYRHDSRSDLKIVSSKQDLNVKVLTWKDSDKGFVKSRKDSSSERISNSKITNNLNTIIAIFITENHSVLVWISFKGMNLENIEKQYWKIVNQKYSDFGLQKSSQDMLEISDSSINSNHEDFFVIAKSPSDKGFVIRFFITESWKNSA